MKNLLNLAKFSAVSVLFGLGFSVFGTELVTNGGFEVLTATNTFAGWTEVDPTKVTTNPVAISGNYSSLILAAGGGTEFRQPISPTGQTGQWTFNVDFACSFPGTGGANRSFGLCVRHQPLVSNNGINLRVVNVAGSGGGDVQLYNQGPGWTTVMTNVVTFTTNFNSLSTLYVNHLQLVGHYNQTTPTYDITITNATGAADTVLNNALYQVAPPTNGNAIYAIDFVQNNWVAGSQAVADNVSLTIPTVYVAPTVSIQPTNVAVYEGAALFTFSSTETGTGPLYNQWFFNGSLLEGQTNATLTLTNLNASMAGAYSLVVSNSVGTNVSNLATLSLLPTVRSSQVSNMWNLQPADRPYLTTDNTQRGLAYNPTSTNLLLVSRNPSDAVIALNPMTGAHNYYLNTSGVTPTGQGVTFGLNMIGVAGDGAVFVGDLTTNGAPTAYDPYILYKWADDGSNTSPMIVFSGDPGGSVAPGLRWGDNIAVRGAGAATQILLAPGTGSNVALLQTQDGYDFQTEIPPVVIAISGVPSGFAAVGLAWGPGTNTFWGKTGATNLYLIQFDLNTQTGVVLQSYSTVPGSVRGISTDTNQQWLAGISIETPDNVRLYNISSLTNGPVLTDQELYTTFNQNNYTAGGEGATSFDGENYFFALDCNNGIKAFSLSPESALTPFLLSVAQSGGNVILSWQSVVGHTYHVQSKNSLTANWSSVGSAILATGTVASSTNTIGAGSMFYRIQAQ